ncbi:MAG TPA: hypothetical protein VLV83_17865 [Acidobacteriota bacterium]|nr:hypothetical protein [Acidobacteriota bacterium]
MRRFSRSITAVLLTAWLAAAPLGAQIPVSGPGPSLQSPALSLLEGAASLWDWASCGFATGALVATLAAPEPTSKAVALALAGEVFGCYDVLFG